MGAWPNKRLIIGLVLLVSALGCQSVSNKGQALPTSSPMPAATASPPATATVSSSTPTPDPYQGLTIQDLAEREYGGGELEVIQENPTGGPFQRIFFNYPSDGLDVHAFMNIPDGEGPFPVVIVLHGYIDPSEYSTLSYTTRYADALAQAGFLTIHPNLRNYPPSDSGPNPFRIGYAIDVLNLVALLEKNAGEPGPFEKALPGAIGLFGHSMGGGISLRAITVDPDIEAAVLYASMSGDERLNYQKIIEWSGGSSGQQELNTPEEDLRRISPIYHLDRIEAAVSIHHGGEDSVVPPKWSEDLCRRLKEKNHPVECFRYSDQPHTFAGEADGLLIQRAVEFFRRELN